MGYLDSLSFNDKFGELITIRTAKDIDAKEILDFNMEVVSEEQYLLTTPSEFKLTLEKEREWIKNINHQPNSIIIIAEHKEKVIGLLDFHSGTKKRIAHTGSFGMSVRKDYRNRGIGKMLLLALNQWVKEKNIIEKISLEVFANNVSAIALYTNMGFEEEGRLKKQIKLEDGTYLDLIQMGKYLK